MLNLLQALKCIFNACLCLLMQKALIRLCYRKIIDATAVKPWEKFVFDDTYTEFLMQVQLYNQEKKYTSFSELLQHVPAAEKLHFLVSTAAIGYIRQLAGKLFLPFENFRFEIINSDIKDKTKHQVAINFYTDHLVWHDTIGNQLLVSVPGNMENDEILTEVFSLQPFLTVYSMKQIS